MERFSLRVAGATLLLGSLTLAACTRFIGAPPTTTPDGQPTAVRVTSLPSPTIPPVVVLPEGRQATVSEVVNLVEARPFADGIFEAVQDGTVIGVTGQVRTGPDSRARVDLGNGIVVRLGADTVFSIGAFADNTGNPFNLLGLDLGRLWVNTAGASVQIITPIGAASITGNLAAFYFNPGVPSDPTDDQLTIDCLTGTCALSATSGTTEAGSLERLIIAKSGLEVSRQPLTEADIQEFVANNPEAETLVSAAFTPTPAQAADISATLQPNQPPTETPSGPTSIAVLGKHIVRSGESLFCIGRAYGVLPSAIAEASGLTLNGQLNVNQELIIPAVRWLNIPGGPVCEQQFNSPFPAGPLATPTRPRPIYVPPVFNNSEDTPTPEPPPTEVPPPTLTPLPVCIPPEYYDVAMDRCRLLDTPAP
jgi:LysM repeat protein